MNCWNFGSGQIHLGYPAISGSQSSAPLHWIHIRLAYVKLNGVYLTAFTRKCTKVNSVGDVIADSTHMLTFVKLHMHRSHYTQATIQDNTGQVTMTTELHDYLGYLLSLTHFIVLYHCIYILMYWRIDLFSFTAARVSNKLTYLLTDFSSSLSPIISIISATVLWFFTKYSLTHSRMGE